ncbi:hypothetical protein HK104_003371 [Borealophlyctis nickersoniae]|nr:hypothetical protein HK104_003371 [Borealophlyctis nickersoniae]
MFTNQIPALDCGMFAHLLGNARVSDVIFILEDQEIPAHASILQNERGGPYFAAVFAHPFKESSDRKIHISEVALRIFKALLQYIYTGRAEVSGTDELAAFVADRFQVTTLLPYIKSELLLSLKAHLPNPDELLSLIQQLKSFPNLSEAVRICVRGVLAKWPDAKTSESWRTMVEGPEARDVFELFMDEAAELPHKAKLLLSLKTHLPNPDELLRLIQQMKSFPDLSEAVRICVRGVLAKWANAKTSESWRTMVEGPEAREVFELFMDEAAEVPNKSEG